MENFTLNGKKIHLSELAESEISTDFYSGFEYKTLSIIQGWLRGSMEFSFQTSGSTGKPKNITFTRNQIVASAWRTIDAFGLQKGNTLLCCINTEFVAGFMMLIRAIVGDMRLIISESSTNPLTTLDSGQYIDFVAMTPIQVQGSMDKSPEKFAQIGTLLIGGAGLDPVLENKLKLTDCRIYHSYAMTETLTHVALRKLGHGENSDIYHALPGVNFEKDTDDCLIIYDKVLGIENLKTNDLVVLINEKSFIWKGRFDNVVNSGGIKIQVDQLEINIRKILLEAGTDVPFCLASVPDEKLTNKLVLIIEGMGLAKDHKKLLMNLKTTLPRFHDPKEIVFVPKLFQTKSGKIDRLKNASVYILNH